MKKIMDERLVLKNLKNIRIAYMLQTLGILGILGYDLVTKGLEGMRDNPLWFVFMLTVIVSAYLSMNISVDHEENKMLPKKGFIISLFIIGALSIVIGVLVTFTDGYKFGLLIGGIIFICGLIPSIYIYYLRSKRQNENDD